MTGHFPRKGIRKNALILQKLFATSCLVALSLQASAAEYIVLNGANKPSRCLVELEGQMIPGYQFIWAKNSSPDPRAEVLEKAKREICPIQCSPNTPGTLGANRYRAAINDGNLVSRDQLGESCKRKQDAMTAD